jgi:hypothetical protein
VERAADLLASFGVRAWIGGLRSGRARGIDWSELGGDGTLASFGEGRA